MSRAERTPHTVAIIGVGSPLGADQFGWQAVEWLQHSDLRKRFSDLQLIFEQSDRPGVLLLQSLRGAYAAIIIDAMQAGLSAGTVRTFTPEQLLMQPTGLFSSHAFGVAESLALGAALGELPQCMLILGIETGDAVCAVSLTANTAAQLLLPIDEFLMALQRSCST